MNKLTEALGNNVGLYEEIFVSKGLSFEKNSEIWFSLEKVPPLYSNLITLLPSWSINEILEKIEANAEKEKWGSWSIKDSYNCLALTEHGFEKLFTASWIYLEEENFKPVGKSKKNYEIVKSKEMFSKWKLAWDKDEVLGNKIFGNSSLNNPNLYFIAGFQGEDLVSGCLVNKTEEVLGISNFFAPNGNISYWSSLVSFIHTFIERKNIVGYEKQELASRLAEIGFENVGALAVWKKQ